VYEKAGQIKPQNKKQPQEPQELIARLEDNRVSTLQITNNANVIQPKGHITEKSEFPWTASFCHFYFNDSTSLAELITFETVNQFDQAFFI
jgi:hypothetical protein